LPGKLDNIGRETLLVDQDPQVLRIVDRCGDELNPACRKGGFKCRHQAIRALHAGALDAVGLGVDDEVGIDLARILSAAEVQGAPPSVLRAAIPANAASSTLSRDCR
jgi:hypothetical protein